MTKIVTFLYFGIGDFPFFGHKVQARWDRYTHSLVQLSQMNVQIICYTGSNTAESLQEILDENGVTNVTIKVKELQDIRRNGRRFRVLILV
jgi:transcriptional regulatory protein LevR